MSKEIYISTTPHETRLAIVEDEQLAEIYYERENEYTLAGSIYNGKVTRVLPGMQSSFVDIGLERDAFLYVTDFMEEQGDAADFEAADSGSSRRAPAPSGDGAPRSEGGRSEGGRSEGRGDRDRGRGRGRDRDRGDRGADRSGERREARPADPTAETESTVSFDEPIAPTPNEAIGAIDAESEGGSRRWRGRRGRRRGRGGNRDAQPGTPQSAPAGAEETIEINSIDAVEDTWEDDAPAAPIEIDLSSDTAQQTSGDRPRFDRDRGRGGRGGRDRGGRSGGRDRDRGPRRDDDRPAPAFDNSYAGYYDDTSLPEPTGEPILLPGESIRKYRDPAEVAAEEEEARRKSPPRGEVIVVSAPSIEIVGWDGGAVLPGESLGRHRNRGQQQTSKPAYAPPAPKPVEAAPVAEPEPAAPDATVLDIPSETFAEHAAEPVAAPAEETPLAPEVEAAITTDLGAADTADGIAAESAPTEYEPEEGASASLTDTTRRDLRRFEAEPEFKPEPATASEPETPAAAPEVFPEISAQAEAIIEAETPDQTPAVPASEAELTPAAEAAPNTAEQAEAVAAPIEERPEPSESNFTTLQADGEMLSIPSDPVIEEAGVTPLPAQDQPAAIPETAVESVTLSEAETTPEPAEADDDLDDEPAFAGDINAYGDGDIFEEEMDELEGDDFEYSALGSMDDGETEEYEEETLEGSTDLGSMLHEMQLDREVDSDDEDEEDTDASGGFTEADFGASDSDEEDEDEAPAEPTSTNGEAQPRRSDRNDRGRRGGRDRDRRGGRNSGGDRGRSGGRRQSMQTTDLPAINELLKPGQEILVQIAKEPIAKKGARITSHIALPGRFLVFMPTVNHTGVSRKISSDEERRRLKSILLSEKGDAQGGFIVRTAADGASEEELRNDLRFLIHLWNDIKQRSETSKSPALIYHDLSLIERILRDQVTDNFSAIWVDSEQEYERVLRFLQRFQPSLVRRVKLYVKETPIFDHFGITAEIDKALKSKVWLKSGGSIVINQTEALVAIDINTGKYVGKTARLEDTILKTNLDAIPEIVRQIRLRDLGGIIVIDFIDMDERKNRAKVLQALEDAMRTDRAPSKILPFNDFGLVIMTRKRVKQSLERTLCMPDPITEGTGMIKSPVTIANEIYVEMKKMHRHIEKGDVLLRVHPEVVKTLKANNAKRLTELEEMTRKTILLKSDPTLSPEAFDIH